tara:strand:- start:289 stop:882 length:594 start_codon:yes stop_codon:yes gene_type:complete
VIIKDPIDFDMTTLDLKNTIESLPDHFLTDIDYIIFGDFDFLKKKGYNASYMDGAIYASNRQRDNINVLDDITHEIGHSVEEKYKDFVYSDMEIEREFLKKRNQLQREFQMAGISIPDEKMNNSDYDEDLDKHFSDVIGYPNMTIFTQGIFYSPYGSTSLREYFANGFEAYFFHKDLYLKKVSPVLFNKLEKLEIGG